MYYYTYTMDLLNLKEELNNIQPDELEPGKEYNLQIYCDNDVLRLYKNDIKT